jgi:hypothetical protein
MIGSANESHNGRLRTPQHDLRSESSVSNTVVWAKLLLSGTDCDRVRSLLVTECGVAPRLVIKRMHITVYHARRPLPGIAPLSEPARVVLPAADTRFMVMYPGGENPRPTIDPAAHSVGIRVLRRSVALSDILVYRRRLVRHETRRILRNRAPSSDKTSAFGARAFQPHMTILKPGGACTRDLKTLAEPFRAALGSLVFDEFEINVSKRT